MHAHFPSEGSPKPRILVADDNRDTVLSVKMLLQHQGYEVRGPLLIAMSGKWNKPSEKLLSQAIGFDHHFEKPCDPQALLRLIKPLPAARACAG